MPSPLRKPLPHLIRVVVPIHLIILTVLFVNGLLSRPIRADEQEEVKRLSAQIGEVMTKSSRKTVAVVDFTDLRGNVTELGRFLAEEFSVALSSEAKDFEVIDRTNLKTILQEHKLASTGIIDPQTARKLGEIAGVQALVTGNITPFGDSVRLSIKVLDTATARIISGFSGDIPRTKTIDELLAKGMTSAGNPSGGNNVQPSSVPAVSPASGPAIGSPTFETESYRVVAQSVQRRGTSVAVNLIFECVAQSVQLRRTLAVNFLFEGASDPIPQVPSRTSKGCATVAWVSYRLYLVDENGDRWNLDVERTRENTNGRALLGGFPYAGLAVLPGTKVKATLFFSPEGQNNGRQFTLAGLESSPKSNREILIQGLK